MKKPVPPSEPKPEGPSRPGINGIATVSIPIEEFKGLCKKLRTNELLGAAAADAFEALAGLTQKQPSDGAAPKVMRAKVAMARDEPEEIPDLPPGKRASIKEYSADNVHQHDLENIEEHVAKDAEEPPELNLNPKQNHMRTDLEMWVMDEIPVLYGVDDSDELDESLQEDGQATKITELIANPDAATQKQQLDAWLKDVPDQAAKVSFMETILGKVEEIQAAGAGKKKKKKKKQEA
jgi:hypothetical protein